MEILNQLPNGGAVVAIIAVVMIFLKKQEHYEDRMDGIVSSFTAELAESRKDYLAQLNRLTSRKPTSKSE